MTEDEAKKKRCCGPRGCGVESNSDDQPLEWLRYCVASKCMAWRWSYPPEMAEYDKIATPNRVARLTAGYCGLGGKP